MDQHFNQPAKRQANLITPPNKLKQKVGSGGLNLQTLSQAEHSLKTTAAKNAAYIDHYIQDMGIHLKYIKKFKECQTDEDVFTDLIGLVLSIKSQGTLAGCPLITDLSNILINFLETVETLDEKAVNIISSFQQALSKLSDTFHDTTAEEKQLVKDLYQACFAYFK